MEIVEHESDKTAELLALPGVEYVQPDMMVYAIDTTPDDTYWADQWGMAQIGAPEAWDEKTDASGIVVAVVDTGIDYNHEDLAENMWVDPDADAPEHTHGYAYTDYTTDPIDDNGHGSHCAGIIGAIGNNTTGVAGACWQVQLMACKFLSSEGGGRLSDGLQAINYAITHGANIISNSWGGGSTDATAFTDIFNLALAANILVVCAAGNSAINHDTFIWKFLPADTDTENNISVAANTDAEELAYFSDFGIESVKIAAPGYEIVSTYKDGEYKTLSGTSMACPHVSGVAALFGARFGWDYAKVRDYILWASECDAAYSDVLETGGRLDVGRMFRYALGSIPVGREQLEDVAVELDPLIEDENVITWTLPTDATGAIICAQDDEYPQEPDESVIYTGPLLTVNDTVTSRDVPRYYSCWATYADGSYGLPVRVRFGDAMEFACPLPPAGYDFICNDWDEDNIARRALLSAYVPAHFWRGASSKYRTWAYGGAGEAREPQDQLYSFGQIMFDGYDIEAEDEPLATDIMDNQTRAHGALFWWDVFTLLNEIRANTELYSDVFGTDMYWTWLDYWEYRDSGAIKTYQYPPRFDEWFTAGSEEKFLKYFACPTNWESLASLARTILYNLRVLYTTTIPWYTSITRVAGRSTAMTKVAALSTGTFNIWFPSQKDPRGMNPGIKANGYEVDIDAAFARAVFVKADGREPYWDGDIFPQPPGPKWIGTFLTQLAAPGFNASAKVWHIPDADEPFIGNSTGLIKYDSPSYDGTWGEVSNSSTAITPPAFDPADPAWIWHGLAGSSKWWEAPLDITGWMDGNESSKVYSYKGETYHKLSNSTPEIYSLRSIWENDCEVYFPATFDWVGTPVDVTVTLRASFISPLHVGNRYPRPAFAKAAGMPVFPQTDETGTVTVTIGGDATGDYSFNPTTLYNDGISETVIDSFTLSTAGPHTKDYTITSSYATDTLPHIVIESVAADGTGSRGGKPATAYSVEAVDGGKWAFSVMDLGEDFPALSWTAGYLMQRWGGFICELVITAELA